MKRWFLIVWPLVAALALAWLLYRDVERVKASGISAPSYGLIKNNGTAVPTRSVLNLPNSGCVDNAGTTPPQTDCTFSVGSAGFNLTDGTSLIVYENFTGSAANTPSQFTSSLVFAQAGTPTETFQTVDGNHPTVMRLATSAASLDNLFLLFGTDGSQNPTAIGPLNAVANWEMVLTVRLPALTNMRFMPRLTGRATPRQLAPTIAEGFAVRFDTPSADTTWKLLTCAASVCTTVDSTVTVNANTFYKLRVYSTVAGTVKLDVTPAGGGVTTVQSNTNISSALLCFDVMLETTTTATTAADFAAPIYFDITGMTRP